MGGGWVAVLADVTLKGTVILAAGWVASLALRRASAAMRHLAWSLAAGALLLLPLAALVEPKWEVRALPASAAVVYTAQAVAGPMVAGGPAPVVKAGASARRTAVPGRWRWEDWAVLVWAAGAAVSLLRLAAGVAASYRLRRAARPMDLAAAGVPVLASGRATMPMTVGLFRPAILLPAGAEAWLEERLGVVIAHELAHIRRHDCLVQALARAALSFYWFHPLAWMAARELVKERERASDDLVLAGGVKASDYAAELLEIARAFRPARSAAWAGVAMARRSQLEGRLLAILDTGARRGVVTRAGLLVTAAATCALVLPLAAMRPVPQAPEAAPIGDLSGVTDFHKLDTAAKAALARGRSEEAMKYYERSLELRKQQFGEQSAEYAAGLVNLAGVYRTGSGPVFRTQPSKPGPWWLYQLALPIQVATLGPDHPDVADTLFYLGMHAQGTKDYDTARQDYQRALDIRTKAFGGSDPRVAQVLTAMALLDETLADTAGAEALYQQALAVVDRAGQQSPESATTLELYARFLRAQDRAAEAESLENRAKPIRMAHVMSVWGGGSTAPGGAARVGGDVRPPTLLFKVEPSYTDLARLAKVQGTVVLAIEVGTDGIAHNIQLKRSLGFGLDETAADALSRWQFRPGTRDGQSVTVQATVEVNFRLL